MAFRVRDLMVDILASGNAPKKPDHTKCGGPSCKAPPQCVPPTMPTGPGGYDPLGAASDLELLRRELRATLEAAPPG